MGGNYIWSIWKALGHLQRSVETRQPGWHIGGWFEVRSLRRLPSVVLGASKASQLEKTLREIERGPLEVTVLERSEKM
jgi:hypothetical protein